VFFLHNRPCSTYFGSRNAKGCAEVWGKRLGRWFRFTSPPTNVEIKTQASWWQVTELVPRNTDFSKNSRWLERGQMQWTCAGENLLYSARREFSLLGRLLSNARVDGRIITAGPAVWSGRLSSSPFRLLWTVGGEA